MCCGSPLSSPHSPYLLPLHKKLKAWLEVWAIKPVPYSEKYKKKLLFLLHRLWYPSPETLSCSLYCWDMNSSVSWYHTVDCLSDHGINSSSNKLPTPNHLYHCPSWITHSHSRSLKFLVSTLRKNQYSHSSFFVILSGTRTDGWDRCLLTWG